MSTYANFSIQSPEKLKRYVKMMLGGGIVSLEITDEQLDFCIEQACETFTKWIHYDFYTYILDIRKAKEITREYPNGNYCRERGFKLPDCIVSVNRLYEGYSSWFSANNAGTDVDFLLWNMGVQNMTPGYLGGAGFGSGQFLNVYLFQNYMKQAQEMFGYDFTFNYNERTKFLKLDPDPMLKKTSANVVVMEVQTIRDEEQIYGEDLVKRLTLALAKQVIGQVRSKFGSGVSFPGGGNISGDILQEGKDEYNTIMEELKQTEPPFMFFQQF